MHSVIFQFITPEISENAFLIDSETLFDDPVVLMRSDYTYDITDKKERKRIIQETLPAFFDGIADVDVENETLTAPTNEFVRFYPIAPDGAINGYRDSPSRSMFCAAFSSLS